MSTLIVKKEVHRLPDVLEPDVIYFVRTGAGFDIYVTDHTGSVAYKANSNVSSSTNADGTMDYSSFYKELTNNRETHSRFLEEVCLIYSPLNVNQLTRFYNILCDLETIEMLKTSSSVKMGLLNRLLQNQFRLADILAHPNSYQFNIEQVLGFDLYEDNLDTTTFNENSLTLRVLNTLCRYKVFNANLCYLLYSTYDPFMYHELCMYMKAKGMPSNQVTMYQKINAYYYQSNSSLLTNELWSNKQVTTLIPFNRNLYMGNPNGKEDFLEHLKTLPYSYIGDNDSGVNSYADYVFRDHITYQSPVLGNFTNTKQRNFILKTSSKVKEYVLKTNKRWNSGNPFYLLLDAGFHTSYEAMPGWFMRKSAKPEEVYVELNPYLSKLKTLLNNSNSTVNSNSKRILSYLASYMNHFSYLADEHQEKWSIIFDIYGDSIANHWNTYLGNRYNFTQIQILMLILIDDQSYKKFVRRLLSVPQIFQATLNVSSIAQNKEYQYPFLLWLSLGQDIHKYLTPQQYSIFLEIPLIKHILSQTTIDNISYRNAWVSLILNNLTETNRALTSDIANRIRLVPNYDRIVEAQSLPVKLLADLLPIRLTEADITELSNLGITGLTTSTSYTKQDLINLLPERITSSNSSVFKYLGILFDINKLSLISTIIGLCRSKSQQYTNATTNLFKTLSRRNTVESIYNNIKADTSKWKYLNFFNQDGVSNLNSNINQYSNKNIIVFYALGQYSSSPNSSVYSVVKGKTSASDTNTVDNSTAISGKLANVYAYNAGKISGIDRTTFPNVVHGLWFSETIFWEINDGQSAIEIYEYIGD